jgi:hypothetical protein
MRVIAVCAIALLLGCPASQPKGVSPMSSPTEPRRIELVEGKSTEVARGVSVTLKTVMYTHATDKTGQAVNDSFMQLEIAHDGRTENVTLHHLSSQPRPFVSVAGIELAIDYVDAYHQPSTGAVLVRP